MIYEYIFSVFYASAKGLEFDLCSK